MAKLPTEVGIIKARKMLANGEATMAFQPTHPDFNRDLYFSSLEAAEARLQSFYANYPDVNKNLGVVVAKLRVAVQIREIVPDNDGRGLCRMTTSLVKRNTYISVKGTL